VEDWNGITCDTLLVYRYLSKVHTEPNWSYCISPSGQSWTHSKSLRD